MEDKALVSICVISYNSAKFVLETLESAKKQSYNYIELQHIENSIPVTRLSEIEDIQLRKHFS